MSSRLAAVALVAAAAVVTAHASAPRAHAQTRSLTVWHAYSEAEERGLRDAIDAFSRRHPGIEVRVVSIPFGSYAAKLEAAIPTGNGPDLFVDAHERLTSYLERRMVQPVGAITLAERLDVDRSALALLERPDPRTHERTLYGLPLAYKAAALFLNDALVRRDPATLEDIEALAGHLPHGVVPLVFEAENAYYVSALLHAYGTTIVDDDGVYRMVGPRAERAIAHLARLVHTGVVPEEASGNLVQQLFASGHAAAAISGPWMAPRLPPELRWHVVPLPRVRGANGGRMQPYSTVETAYVAARAHEPGLARELARFLAGPEGARIRAAVGRQPIASRTVALERRDDAFVRAFLAAASHARPMPSHPHMRAAFEPANKAVRKALRGLVGVHDALEEGRRRFDDDVRPEPPRRDPMWALFAIGVLLLVATIYAAQRARDPELRVALRASAPAYAWVAHAALAVGVLVVLPLVVGAGTSFFAGHGTDLHYVGLANYVDIVTARGGSLLGSGSFWAVLLVTVLWTVINISFHVGIGVALALLLHRPALKLRGLYRVLLILPWAVPSYVTALAWKGMFHRQFGAINAMLDLVGVEPVSWFARFSTAFSANVATNVWLGFPFMMVVTLGALSSIPKDLYEAAAVDGATAWQRFKAITVPLLRPALAPAVAMGAVWTFNMFNVVFLVSGGEPDGSTEILVSEAYRWAFTRSAQYGYAAAYAVLIFGVLALATRSLGRLDGAGSTR